MSKLELIVMEENKYSKRKLYVDKDGIYYLDCKQCGIALLSEFGNDKKGFVGKRNECTPCRRRTKEDRDKIGTKTTLTVENELVEVIYYLVSQSRRFAFKDDNGEIYFICTQCNEAKHMDDFYKETGGLLDTKSTCKICTDHKNRKWEQANYEYYLETQRSNYNVNKEKRRIQRKEYREENKVFIYESKKVYRKQNRVKLYFTKKAYREGIGKEKERDRIKRFYDENPYKQSYYTHLRLARERSLPHTLTEEQLLKILNNYNGKCCFSGETAHIDHIIPLAVGHGGTTYENILPLSQVLNGSKQDKNIFEWFELVHEHYNITLERFNEVMTEVASRNGMTLNEYREYVNWCFENPRRI